MIEEGRGARYGVGLVPGGDPDRFGPLSVCVRTDGKHSRPNQTGRGKIRQGTGKTQTPALGCSLRSRVNLWLIEGPVC
jgi:hypothetical protein